MSDTSAIFSSSVQTAVQESVATNKPLLVFVSDDSTRATEFFERYFQDEDLYHKLEVNFISLRLIKGSQECGFFEQIFPDTIVPSFYILKSGSLVDVLYGNVELDNFKERIDKVLNISVEPAIPESNPVDSAAPVAPVAPVSAPVAPMAAPIAAPVAPVAAPMVPVPSIPSSSTPSNSNSRRQTPSGTSSPAPARQYHSLKEEAAEMAAKRHKEETLKQKKLAREERERILKLLESDKEERKLKERRLSQVRDSQAKGDESPDTVVPTQDEIHENVHHTHKYSKCVLAIKLFDGTSLRHEFASKDSLQVVRNWTDKNRTDGDDAYVFHRAVPRVTYDETEESNSLQELNLAPRSALILKPVTRNVVTSYQNQGSWIGSGLKRIGGALTSFLSYGYGDNESDSSSSGSSSNQPQQAQGINLRSGSSSPIISGATSPIFSVGPTNTSQLHSTPSLLSLSQTNPMPIVADSIPSRAHSPRLVSQTSQARVRTLRDNEADDRLTYNGNQLNLEDNNKDKKK